MQYADIIAREADSLPLEKQAEVLDFIEFLKVKQSRKEDSSRPQTTEEIEAFFRSFKVDTSGYKFDREEANAR
jgi:Ca2+-binding EF-hand superfamily protein